MPYTMSPSAPAFSSDISVPAKFGCGKADNLKCLMISSSNQRLPARIRFVNSYDGFDVLRITFRPPRVGAYQALVQVNGTQLPHPLPVLVQGDAAQPSRRASAPAVAEDDGVVNALFADQSFAGRASGRRRQSSSPPRTRAQPVMRRNASEPQLGLARINSAQRRGSRQGFVPRCCMCRSNIKPGSAVELEGRFFCRHDFRNLFIKDNKAHSLKTKLLQQGKVSQQDLQLLPNAMLHGLKVSQVQQLQSIFRRCGSHSRGAILLPDLLPAVRGGMATLVGGQRMNALLEQEIRHVVESFVSGPAASATGGLASEVTFLNIMAALWHRWTKGDLRSKTPASAPADYHDPPLRQTPTRAKSSRHSSSHGEPQGSMTVGDAPEPSASKGLQISGSSAADSWMMY